MDSLCPECSRLRSWASRGTYGRRQGHCRRCGYPQPVARDGTCRACLLAVRFGQDEQWMWAEVRREYLPSGRPRQLAFSLGWLKLPDARPIRNHDQPMVVQKIPPWVRALSPRPVRDDPRVCPPQMPGQLALFPTPRRTFAKYDGGRIHDRDIPDLPLVVAELRKIAKVRGVKEAWFRTTWHMARLALAAREPGERQVRPELVPQLPMMHPTVGEALELAGLLAPKRARLVAAEELVHGSCEHCLTWANDRLTVCIDCRQWSYLHPGTGNCDRCHRLLPLARGLCRFCTLVIADELPVLTEGAAAVADDFAAYIRQRGWRIAQLGGSIRTLRILLAHLGIDAPIAEVDVKAVAALSSNHQGARVANYLRRRGLLAPEPQVDPNLARARTAADRLPKAYGDAVHAWIDVLTGQGSKPSLPRTPETVDRYVRDVAPVLQSWHHDGLDDPREITKEHIEQVLKPLRGTRARGAHVGLRSMFRALKRERLVFRDPARTVALVVARHLPVALPSDRLQGLLGKVPDVRSRLIIALVAIHALLPIEVARLLVEDLDRAHGKLRVRRPGRLDHVVYLDELTMALATAWIAERFERWPDGTNRHLIVSRQTAIDDLHPTISTEVTNKPFQRIGIPAGKLRQDRILDEARHTADPVGLMRVFGLSNASATKYVAAAHPDKRPDPIQA
ncbi:site-specific integrase [Streptomyces atratus]|uniref:site-specific integrase n=1 Tax=Streptomyces atratus TaxID=1893 RepID=UPI00224D8E72|nr:site-specific integrase [Streptomyces atratus]MCX5345807.1 site-specific integrase [Streptomyces atratus]